MSGASQPTRQPPGLFSRQFGNLRIRPKLIVLHNLFFLVLTTAVYFFVIPHIEEQTAAARDHEIGLLTEMFAEGRRWPLQREGSTFQYDEGSADGLGVPAEATQWLNANPGAVWQDPHHRGSLFRKDPQLGLYARVTIPGDFYEQLVLGAKTNLFLVLGAVYILAVFALELIVMPRYVYRPIRLTLEADEAARDDDRENELIDEKLIPGDEIGDIMRSHNRTVAQVRDQKAHLQEALAWLEDLNRDLRNKNELLEAAKHTMAAQDRLVSLGLMSSSVAHELNTPLAVLHGSIEQLRESTDDPAAQRRLERMQRMTERLRHISLTLLDFSRPRREKTEPVAIRRLVKEAWGLVGFDERAARVRFSNQTDVAHRVEGNYDRLMQVFVNLLRNALYAVKAGGRIVVHSKGVQRDGHGFVVIAVDDDGPGIPEEVLPNIFEAFVTSRLDSRGTGLGLTVARGIVTRHGGEIVASNREEGGARLEVKLPAALSS